jgi:5-carboxymethyl-2-hydroxymuconate isomerase
MPHLTLEYSNNLVGTVNLNELFKKIHRALAEFDSVRLSEIKSRAIPYDQYHIGDGSPQRIFIHLTVAVLDTKPLAEQKQISELMLSILGEEFARSNRERPCDITVEIRPICQQTYGKMMNSIVPFE